MLLRPPQLGPLMTTSSAKPVPNVEAGPSLASALVPTIFHEPWWLEHVSAGRIEEVRQTVDGRCVGRLPYLLSKQHGMTAIGMPMLTHFLGPAIDEGPGNATTRLIKRITITKELIARLPRASSLWIKFHRETTDTLAFQAAGYLNGVQFTSEIGPAPESKLWAGMRDTARRVIRRAAEHLTVIEVEDPDRFMSFYENNLRDRGVRNEYDPKICRATIAEAIRRGVGRMSIAIDDKSRFHAGVFTVWDKKSEYYLMTTRKKESDNGAISLLIWNALKHASENGLVFDLDGFSNSGDIQFFTRFGGQVTPRYFIQRSSPLFRLVGKFCRME